MFRVCGRVQIDCVDTIKELIEGESAKIALDLSEVTLANRDAATFLAACERKRCRAQEVPRLSSCVD